MELSYFKEHKVTGFDVTGALQLCAGYSEEVNLSLQAP